MEELAKEFYKMHGKFEEFAGRMNRLKRDWFTDRTTINNELNDLKTYINNQLVKTNSRLINVENFNIKIQDDMKKIFDRMDDTRNILFNVREIVSNIGKINTRPIFEDLIRKIIALVFSFLLGGMMIHTPLLHLFK